MIIRSLTFALSSGDALNSFHDNNDVRGIKMQVYNGASRKAYCFFLNSLCCECIQEKFFKKVESKRETRKKEIKLLLKDTCNVAVECVRSNSTNTPHQNGVTVKIATNTL